LRIDNNLRTGNVTGRGGNARGTGSGPAFHIGESGNAPRAAAAATAAPANGIDALLALQAAGDPLQGGRKKQVRRGRSLLDTLDALKADLITGRVTDGHLDQLMTLIGQARERTEPGLDGLLDDIELRARVELAKRGIFPAL
jgi:hypothetical protein